MKRWIALCLALLLLGGSLPALAVGAGESRTVIGNDISSDETLRVYETFGIARGSVTELYLSNTEERDYLEGLVDESIIGTRSISCVYIELLPEGAGLSVECSNINWCTEAMYLSALNTAGIRDAKVIVTAPFSVSGTAALAGIYKAYEDMLGVSLSETDKEAAVDELVTTAALADELGEEAAISIVNELKAILDETQDMTDEELRAQIIAIADSYGYVLEDSLIVRLIQLCRRLEGISLSTLQSYVQGGLDLLQTVRSDEGFFQKLLSWIGDIFSGLFGGKKANLAATTALSPAVEEQTVLGSVPYEESQSYEAEDQVQPEEEYYEAVQPYEATDQELLLQQEGIYD